MPISRIYYPHDLKEETTIHLDARASHYLLNVLRLKLNRTLIIFNGQGGQYHARLASVEKKIAIIDIQTYEEPDTESSLKIELGQGVSRGERMDYAIQKSVELGVTCITPLLTERCNVNLTDSRIKNRLAHWKGVIVSACEQSGRCLIPELESPITLSEWVEQSRTGTQWVCDPQGKPLERIEPSDSMTILVGPEGGLTNEEIDLAAKNNFIRLALGPRTLRTETAAVVGVSLLQTYFGDL